MIVYSNDYLENTIYATDSGTRIDVFDRFNPNQEYLRKRFTDAGAITRYTGQIFYFAKEKHLTWFILRWS